jgi:hypothetical protein
VVEGATGGQPPPPVGVRDALAQTAVAVLGRVRPQRVGLRRAGLPRAGRGDRLRTAQLGTSPDATKSVGSVGACRPGSRLTA